MTTSTRDSPEALVRHFFSATPASFSFIVRASGYQSRAALQQATSSGLEDVAPDRMTGWFWAVWRFDTDRASGEVRFGERENALSIAVAPACEALEFELWEWCQIDSTEPTLRTGDGQFCDTVDRLQRELDRYSAVLRDRLDRIVAARPSDLGAIREARSKRLEAWISSGRESQHVRARAQADEAFRSQDYLEVLKLLAPFESALTPAERAKVAIARRKSGYGPG
jgi:hypothetical protein